MIENKLTTQLLSAIVTIMKQERNKKIRRSKYDNLPIERRLELFITTSVINHMKEWGMSCPLKLSCAQLAEKMQRSRTTIWRQLKLIEHRFIKEVNYNSNSNGLFYILDIDSICSKDEYFESFIRDFGKRLHEKTKAYLHKKREEVQRKQGN